MKAYPEIYVAPETYQGIIKGGLVNLSERTRKSAGQIFKIINLKTGSYAIRKLQVANERGYFVQVF